MLLEKEFSSFLTDQSAWEEGMLEEDSDLEEEAEEKVEEEEEAEEEEEEFE
ncbi:hypothetical protein L6250_00505 [Candidatus Parcubacteria bacterium]|nr:hypothetical protein [Patescibacteria group bacterium]MBU4466871.1 hypothetical protein [Patescibacteria group bacterium]MCG2688109.1 hypothetical protein [Candidatus Parcubacteria bacterium]